MRDLFLKKGRTSGCREKLMSHRLGAIDQSNELSGRFTVRTIRCIFTDFTISLEFDFVTFPPCCLFFSTRSTKLCSLRHNREVTPPCHPFMAGWVINTTISHLLINKSNKGFSSPLSSCAALRADFGPWIWPISVGSL